MSGPVSTANIGRAADGTVQLYIPPTVTSLGAPLAPGAPVDVTEGSALPLNVWIRITSGSAEATGGDVTYETAA